MNILIILHHNSTMNTETNDACVFLLVQGSPLDSDKKGSMITLSNNGRNASLRSGHGSVVGTVGCSSGLYQWRINITKLGRGYIGIGVSTLPLTTYKHRSDFKAYFWFSDQRYSGLAASQTGGLARVSKWQTEDILILTLNCAQRQRHRHLQRTAEKKTVNMNRAIRGEKWYLCIFLYSYSTGSGKQVDIFS